MGLCKQFFKVDQIVYNTTSFSFGLACELEDLQSNIRSSFQPYPSQVSINFESNDALSRTAVTFTKNWLSQRHKGFRPVKYAQTWVTFGYFSLAKFDKATKSVATC